MSMEGGGGKGKGGDITVDGEGGDIRVDGILRLKDGVMRG